MIVETRDLLIVREVSLKAAVELLSGEVADSRVLAWATTFEDWILRDLAATQQPHTQAADSTYRPQEAQGATTQTSPPAEWEPDPPREPQRTQTAESFDADKCPRHPDKTDKSNFGGLWCKGPGHDQKCDWARKTFINNEGTPDEHTVSKYRWGGKWLGKVDYIDAVRREGILA